MIEVFDLPWPRSLPGPGCRCKLEADISATDGIEIGIDKSRIIQVMNNLISNAAKFTRDDDVVMIRTAVENNIVRVSIIDHGPGIPMNKREHIFDRFVQATSAVNQKLPGTGLGLNLCKFIIESHDGTIGFKSEENIETEFYFTVPINR